MRPCGSGSGEERERLMRGRQDVPAFHVAAGNPARVLRRIDTSMDPEQARGTAAEGGAAGAEEPMAEMAEKLEGGGDGGRQ